MEADEYWWHAADGLKLFSRLYPGPSAAAPVVLCLHGLMRTGRDFEDLAPHLAQRFRVIVPDVRGRGFSARDGNPANYQIPIYVSDLLRLLTGLGAASVNIIGTSMGGLIAMILAAAHRNLVARIVLNDVGPEIDPVGLQRISSYAGRATGIGTWEEAAAELRKNFAMAWPDLPPSRWSQLARRCYRPDATGVIRADADPAIGEIIRSSAAAAPNLWEWWARLARIPILALRGELSDVLSAATLGRMHAEKPNLQSVIVRNRGHVPLLDEPEVLAALDEFLIG